MSEVTFCNFEQLFDQNLTKVLLGIFDLLGPDDFDSCVHVCHAWRIFIGRHYVSEIRRRDWLLRRKLPHEWLHAEPSVMRIPISKNLAPPLKIYADQFQVMLTTIDSVLVWNRRQKDFKGEFGPEISGSSHVMIRSISFNKQIMVSIHKHTTNLLVWSRRNFKIIQEVPCVGIEGFGTNADYVKVCDHMVVVWLDDGSIHTYNVAKDGTLRKNQTLNGHIAGNHDADISGSELLTASSDSKVNLWDLNRGRLKWSNHRTEARYKKAKLSRTKAVVAGSYEQEGYLQIYDRASGDVIHELLTLEGNGIQNLLVTDEKIVAQLSIKHKLLTSKIMVLDSSNGDLITEQTYVDVLDMSLVRDQVLVMLNNQVGDFRTRISVYDLSKDSNIFENERVIFQYAHNYWKLPAFFDDRSVIHTTEEKDDLYVRDFDGFFTQFAADRRELSLYEREQRIAGSTLCYRLRRILFRKICSRCSIM